MSGARAFFAVCVMLAVGLIGFVTGSALHPQTVMPAEAAAGWQVWQANGCEGCHTLYGIGGNYGPDLTHIYEERGETYLREFFVNPNAFHPDQRVMPRFNLTRDETTRLIALLQTVGAPQGEAADVVKAWPPHPIRVSGTGGVMAAAAPAVANSSAAETALAAGKVLFGQNCASCHSLEKDVVVIGPSLWGIADRGWHRVPGKGPEQYIRESVLHPSDYVVAGFQDVMQKNLGEKLSADDLDHLIAFLMQYKENS